MSEKEDGHKTDLNGEIAYDQNRVVSGSAPHNLIEREMQKYLSKDKDGNEEPNLLSCRDCGTTENVNEVGLCSFCEEDREIEEEEEDWADGSSEYLGDDEP